MSATSKLAGVVDVLEGEATVGSICAVAEGGDGGGGGGPCAIEGQEKRAITAATTNDRTIKMTSIARAEHGISNSAREGCCSLRLALSTLSYQTLPSQPLG